ncbi:MAG: type I polyketide synthase, partial [Acidobacteriota bacterium]
QRASSEPIAITGLACRMPGGIETPDAFWDLLKDGVDPIREVPDERWPADLYARLAPDLAGTSKPRAGFVDRLDAFDPHFFGISPREALTMDPQHRMVLETSWEALEDAGQAPDRLKGSLTGVFLGITAIDYAVHLRVADRANLDVYTATGSAHNAAAGRISYTLGLHGPSMAIDTACSSSLTAVHLACQSLRLKESDLVIAGGVNTLIIPDWFISMVRWGMLAPDGRCKAFDAAADGMVRAEGCGIVVMKRLSDALASGDRILAVVRGSAVNQDGPSSGLTVPNGPAQEAVLRQALRAAGVKPSDVGYVEAHGTGTTLGDPIELEALDAVLSEGRPDGATLIVGSVKSNVGHLEAASGIAGLIKVVLSLQHGEIPPNLHFQTLNPAITLRHLQLHVPTTAAPWPRSQQPRIAGVSSFGLSGTNAHVILEEAPRALEAPANASRPVHLLTISARTASALRTQAGRWRDALAAQPGVSPGDVAHAANTGRSALPHRAALLAASVAQFTEQLSALSDGKAASGLTTGQVRPKDRPRVVFLFTGQGSQYAGMARDLYRTQPVFRESLDRSDALLRSVLDRPLLSIIHPDSQDEASRLRINETAYTQPALFALEYALCEMWTAWGIKPAAVMGHSVGEYVAACAAGVFGLEDGLRLIAARGRLMQALPTGGAMSAVMSDEATVRDTLRGRWDDLSIAAVNGPASVVISGPGASIDAAVAALQADGIASQPLTVSHAFHSSLMDPMLPAFVAAVRSIPFAAPRIPFVSNLTGRLFEKGEVPGAEYWARHLREPVRFADGMSVLAERGFTTFLELGPGSTLSSLGARCLKPQPGVTFLTSLRRDRPDWYELLASLGSLSAAGAPIDWEACDRGFSWTGVSLPTYPFERERYWVDAVPDMISPVPQGPAAVSSIDGNAAGSEHGAHPLLGRRLRSASRDLQFERQLGAGAPAFLGDHVIHGRVVMPATAFVEMMTAAADVVWGPGGHRISDVTFAEPLVLDARQRRAIQSIVTRRADGSASAEIFSAADDQSVQGGWTLHAAADLAEADGVSPVPGEPLAAARGRCNQPWLIEELYAWYRSRGIEYGERFACLERVWRGDREAVGTIRWPDSLGPDTRGYRLHPAIVDACMQTVAAALPDLGGPDRSFVPVNIEQVVSGPGGGPIVWSHVRLRKADAASDTLTADLSLFDVEERLVAQIRGLRGRAISAAAWAPRDRGADDWQYEIVWRHTDSPAAGTPLDLTTQWVIVGNPGGLGTSLVRRITDQGGRALLSVSKPETTALVDPWLRIATDGIDRYDALCRETAARSSHCGFVYLDGMDGPTLTIDDAGAEIEAAAMRGCEGL